GLAAPFPRNAEARAEERPGLLTETPRKGLGGSCSTPLVPSRFVSKHTHRNLALYTAVAGRPVPRPALQRHLGVLHKAAQQLRYKQKPCKWPVSGLTGPPPFAYHARTRARRRRTET